MPKDIIVPIKTSMKGVTYTFIIENEDYSGYTAALHVWLNGTALVDGGTCSAAYDGTDTAITYVIPDAIYDTIGLYDAEIQFTSGLTIIEPTRTFYIEVEQGAP